MYKREQGSKEPGDEWNGPARITGFENKVSWMVHSGVPIAAALHLIRPASIYEMLAYQVMSRNLTPLLEEAQPRAEGEEQRFLYLRQKRKASKEVVVKQEPDIADPVVPLVRHAPPMAHVDVP